MKVILLRDDKNLGKKGDLIEASDGYARNYLIPKKIGMEATAKNLNDLRMQKAKKEKQEREQQEAAQAMAELLMGKQAIVRMKAGEGGRVFGSVSAKEIAAAFQEQHNLTVDRKKIQLPENLKSFGSYEIPLKLHPKVTGKLNLKVVEA
jgi:large subunit ribosomal protein L9